MLDKIGFCGKMGSGKTTCSSFLVENFGFRKISLADPVYQVVLNIDKYHPEELYKKFLEPYINPPLPADKRQKFIQVIEKINEIPKETPKPRKRLQWFGTEGGRNTIDKDIWIDILLEKVRQNPKQKIVIDDVRFVNEAKKLRKAGFFIIKLQISESEQMRRLFKLYQNFDPKVLKHDSEVEIDLLENDIIIDACKTKEEVFNIIRKIVRG